MKAVLDQLKDGIRKFQTEVYPERAEAYRVAATTQQKPHTLLITCADSRIDPEAITSSVPGEMFVTRNVGNMVPAYGEMLGGVSAVIEYAVEALGVQHAVVCGHSDCGAMKGLLGSASDLERMPTVKSWLRNAAAALMVTQGLAGENASPKTLLHSLTEQNVLLQLNHLRTHPSIAGGLAKGTLTVSGWVYDIEHGEVKIYDDVTNKFLPVSTRI
ncbi:carbonic anhydrase [Terriglobus saanensis]|uniref:carbonic anhydrase n=1 Tax=Terriglobus saanensis (strain ATCC BAA-1853 / DSM 23119 / SP1PR4) TaxID=401053 RepID=E8V6B7_TERSS|nr:carbonic anhydrase [Terriglobus saanensis]ADV81582.1 Carbonate dehydratase [Terriglobus saanensis SP1PR4]